MKALLGLLLFCFCKCHISNTRRVVYRGEVGEHLQNAPGICTDPWNCVSTFWTWQCYYSLHH